VPFGGRPLLDFPSAITGSHSANKSAIPCAQDPQTRCGPPMFCPVRWSQAATVRVRTLASADLRTEVRHGAVVNRAEQAIEKGYAVEHTPPPMLRCGKRLDRVAVPKKLCPKCRHFSHIVPCTNSRRFAYLLHAPPELAKLNVCSGTALYLGEACPGLRVGAALSSKSRPVPP
jgi:hypothetical protein